MKDTYTKEEVLKLLEEQRQKCAEKWYYIAKSSELDKIADVEFFADLIKNTPLATGETDFDGWISVEEKPKSGIYIVFDPNGFGSDKITMARFDLYNSKWFGDDDTIHPTHYRLRPNPPKI